MGISRIVLKNDPICRFCLCQQSPLMKLLRLLQILH